MSFYSSANDQILTTADAGVVFSSILILSSYPFPLESQHTVPFWQVIVFWTTTDGGVHKLVIIWQHDWKWNDIFELLYPKSGISHTLMLKNKIPEVGRFRDKVVSVAEIVWPEADCSCLQVVCWFALVEMGLGNCLNPQPSSSNNTFHFLDMCRRGRSRRRGEWRSRWHSYPCIRWILRW